MFCICRAHRAANNVELSLNSPSYVCVLSTDGDLANLRAHALPPTNIAERRGGGDVKLLANTLSS
jgi:hypothetical protein